MKLLNKMNKLISSDRAIHSVKTAFACFLGFVIAHYLYFPVDQWLIITILVVMCAQINVGSMLIKSWLRLLGTFGGSLIAISTLFIFGNSTIAIPIAVIFSALLFSFVATSKKSWSESGTLGAVTVAIILIGQNPTVKTGFNRCIEITIGIIIAALVSQFVLPIHARSSLRRNQAKTIRMLRKYFLEKGDTLSLHQLDESIAKSLLAQRKLAEEAKREAFGAAFNIDYFNQSLWCEKEILRSIIFMRHAYRELADHPVMLNNAMLLLKFNNDICETLEKIAGHVEKKTSGKFPIPDIKELKNMLLTSHDTFTSEDRIALDSYLFSAKILTSRLERLIELIWELDDRRSN